MHSSEPTPAVTLGAGVVKRTTLLADGRELIYYDDPDTTLGPERRIDARSLVLCLLGAVGIDALLRRRSARVAPTPAAR